MTEHLDDGLLQALLDQELSGEEARDSREHLAGCPDCRGRLVETREANHVLGTALAQLDLPRQDRSVVPLRPPSTVRRPMWRRIGLARAAALLLTVAAGASATIPGSPVRGWIAGAFEPSEPSSERVATTAAPAQPALTTQAAESGVSVQMAGGRFLVVLSDAAPELRVRATLVEGQLGGVYAVGDPAGDARFRTAPGSIRVDRIDADELRVEIPRAALAASIEVNGSPYLVKDGEQLRLVTADGDSTPTEILFRVRR